MIRKSPQLKFKYSNSGRTALEIRRKKKINQKSTAKNQDQYCFINSDEIHIKFMQNTFHMMGLFAYLFRYREDLYILSNILWKN